MFYEKVNIRDTEIFVCERVSTPFNDYPYHFHPEYEVIFVWNASGKRFIGNSIEDFHEFDLAILGPNTPHKWKFEKSSDLSRSVVLKFKPELIHNVLFGTDSLQSFRNFYRKTEMGLVMPSREIVLETGQRLEEILKSGEMDKLLKMTSMLYDFSLYSWEKVGDLPTTRIFNQKEMRKVDEIYNYIMSNFRESLSVEDLAERFNYSPSGFFQLFKRHTGYKVSEFINKLRVQESCKLIKQTDFSISEICYSSGFQNLSYFNRIFKREMNMSPRRYRDYFMK